VVTTDFRLSGVTLRLAAMLGTAVLTMVASSCSMNRAVATSHGKYLLTLVELFNRILFLGARCLQRAGAPLDCHTKRKMPISTGRQASGRDQNGRATRSTTQLTPLFGCLMPPLE
jgi:hypothetical protein